MLPSWIKSQKYARLICAKCPEPATAEVTFADTGAIKLLCRSCWDSSIPGKG